MGQWRRATYGAGGAPELAHDRRGQAPIADAAGLRDA